TTASNSAIRATPKLVDIGHEIVAASGAAIDHFFGVAANRGFALLASGTVKATSLLLTASGQIFTTIQNVIGTANVKLLNAKVLAAAAMRTLPVGVFKAVPKTLASMSVSASRAAVILASPRATATMLARAISTGSIKLISARVLALSAARAVGAALIKATSLFVRAAGFVPPIIYA